MVESSTGQPWDTNMAKYAAYVASGEIIVLYDSLVEEKLPENVVLLTTAQYNDLKNNIYSHKVINGTVI